MIRKLLAGFLGNWEFVLAAMLAFALWSGAIALKAHHAGHESGVASMQAKVDTANTKVGQLTQQRDDALAAVGRVHDQLVANKAAEDAAEKSAQQALAKAQAERADADKALSAWMARYAKALRTPACQTPSVNLCPALQDY